MEIKQEYKDKEGNEVVNFTYIGEPEGVIFDGSNVIFRNRDITTSFYITQIAELMPYFEKWIKS